MDKPAEHDRRTHKTVMTFIEYKPAVNPKPKDISSPTELKELFQSLSNEPSKETPLRLFIVEDLSQQVIELLGSRFDIDPMFFREQIDEYVWYNVRDPWAQPPGLMSNMKHRNWFRLRNMRLRYYKTDDEFQKARLETNAWNVLRRPDNDENHWNYQDSKHAVVSIMRTRTTMWIGKDKECNNGTVGIVLVDPTVSQGQPLWHDRTNWLPTPKMHAPPAPVVKQSESWYKDIVNMTAAFPWFEVANAHDINLQVLAKPTLYTICAEWLVVCDYVKARLSQIEWELEMPDLFRSKGDVIEDSLRRLHTWRRQIPVFREMVTETLEQALPAAARLTSTRPMPSFAPNSPLSAIDTRSLLTDTSVINFEDVSGYEDIIPDFRRVLAAVNELQERVDRLTDIVTSEIGIEDSRRGLEDSRRGLEENHNMARLTWLATIFIPLSFISSMYSMNEDISALKTTYGWFFLTALPFTLTIMAIGWVAGGGSLTPWKKQDDTKQRGVIGGREVNSRKNSIKKT
jgi:Mg2+ and Co2+ transporter CorA